MSYDLAVWEGDTPADDRAADAEYQRLFDRYLEGDATEPPTAAIQAYRGALADRFGDLDGTADDTVPWSSGPGIGDASGPVVYFGMTWDRQEDVAPVAARLAAAHGLVCYDPQLGTLRPGSDGAA